MKSIVFDFKKNDVEILDYFFSPYYIKSNNLNYRSCKNFLKRKPNNGMILEACNKHKINIQKSIFIGDQKSDFYLSRKFKNLRFINFDIKKRKNINNLKSFF